MSRPPLALSLGEPAGIGPEICFKAWRSLRAQASPFFVIGDARVVGSAPGAEIGQVSEIGSPEEARDVFPDALPVLHRPCIRTPEPGRPDPANAAAVVDWIREAAHLALSGRASAVVTSPIAKAPLYAAGFKFPGHTEFLAHVCDPAGGLEPVMMLCAGDLRVTLATIHLPLRRAPDVLTIEGVARVAEATVRALRADFGIPGPRIAVAALNPHAGEDGALGDEEIRIIGPAAQRLRAQGVACEGPLPSDSLFHPDARKRYDAVVCMYHDQALIPVKMLDFWGGVNMTLNLPIVRTSPDHGTGFDIAGRGIARADSLLAAIRLAAEVAERRAGVR